MLRKSTLFTLLILASLIALAVYLSREKNQPAENLEPTPTADSSALFGPEEGILNGLKIESDTQGTVEVVREAEGTWSVKQPIEGKADPAQAEAAATQAAAMRVMGEVEASPEDTGLVEPAYTLTLGFTGGKEHVLEIGDETPSMIGYYARLDDGLIIIVSTSGIQSLLDMLSAPPYLETPTPSPIPATETPTAMPGTGTPEGITATAVP